MDEQEYTEPKYRREMRSEGSVWQCCVCGQQYLIKRGESLEDFICSVCTHLDTLVPVDD